MILVSVIPIRLHHIPLVLRSNKINRWTYIQRMKLVIFFLFMLMSSFFAKYNMYDLSKGCLTCYGSTMDCEPVENYHFGMTIVGVFVTVPTFLAFFLNLFSDKIKYLFLPILLINILFFFALVVMMQIAMVWYLVNSGELLIWICHLVNYAILIITFILAYIFNKCKS